MRYYTRCVIKDMQRHRKEIRIIDFKTAYFTSILSKGFSRKITHLFSLVVSTIDLEGDSRESFRSGEKSGFFNGALIASRLSFSSETI